MRDNKSPGYIAGWLIGCIILAFIVIVVGALAAKTVLLLLQWLF